MYKISGWVKNHFTITYDEFTKVFGPEVLPFVSEYVEIMEFDTGERVISKGFKENYVFGRK